jgi:methylmalonyl-CoA/ethylmalonyl-CoA epimerase
MAGQTMRFHHVGIAVDNIQRAAAHYRDALGITLTSEITEDEIQKVRVAFAQAGDGVFIEFIEPMSDDSPVAGVLKRKASLYHMCFVVPDIDAAVERACQAGARLVSSPKPARAFDGRRIAFIYLTDRSLVELLEE